MNEGSTTIYSGTKARYWSEDEATRLINVIYCRHSLRGVIIAPCLGLLTRRHHYSIPRVTRSHQSFKNSKWCGRATSIRHSDVGGKNRSLYMPDVENGLGIDLRRPCITQVGIVLHDNPTWEASAPYWAMDPFNGPRQVTRIGPRYWGPVPIAPVTHLTVTIQPLQIGGFRFGELIWPQPLINRGLTLFTKYTHFYTFTCKRFHYCLERRSVFAATPPSEVQAGQEQSTNYLRSESDLEIQ